MIGGQVPVNEQVINNDRTILISDCIERQRELFENIIQIKQHDKKYKCLASHFFYPT